ncbi:4'-phosphopantetheinyl transferase superfamily protein [Herbiconiux sp. 11R-BC]|uniref:4'-phosphopantetheinyl transferase family protein n=1 Tax=Herbiconiux sp. 11R-BC TaxID=3111637 RepID=UPI003BFCA931
MSDASGAPLLRLAFLRDTGDRAADHAALSRLAGAPAPAHDAAEARRIGHLCLHCGSTGHGRPLLLDADGMPVPGVHLSLSRAGGVVALAAAAHPVGIDIESVSTAAAARFDDVAFTAAERAAFGDDPDHRMRTRAWAAKEAVLKAAGLGLRADPHALTVVFEAIAGPLPYSAAAHLEHEAVPRLAGSTLDAAPAADFALGEPELPSWLPRDLVVVVATTRATRLLP